MQVDTSDSERIAENDQLRSKYVRSLLMDDQGDIGSSSSLDIPLLFVQYWSDPLNVPTDVLSCIESWKPLEKFGFTRLLFDDRTAAGFIRGHFDERHVIAFSRCVHPAMRADYFRLCFLARIGGFYVDADDYYGDGDVRPWLCGDLMRVRPLCYDINKAEMVEVETSLRLADSHSRIFYVNNNPIIAPPGHPLIMRSLSRATASILDRSTGEWDIQSTTGPGNLTACLVMHAIETAESNNRDFTFISNWEAIAKTQWSLDYRRDDRNWRLWDGREEFIS